MIVTIIQVIFGSAIAIFMVKIFVEKFRDRKKVLEKIQSPIDQTDDLRIVARTYRNLFMKFAGNMDYCKFIFANNEMFLVGRNSYPKDIYTEFLVLNSSAKNDYSGSSKCSIKKFVIANSDLTMQIQNGRFTGSQTTLYISGLSENDKLILSKYIGEIK